MSQNRITKAARGRDCQIRIPGVCNGNSETVVLAHYRLAGTCGTGMKPPAILGAWACSSCHDAVDQRSSCSISRDELRLYHAEAVMRTINVLCKEGIVEGG